MLVSTHYMDEAERCHEIAYISYGELIARGTAEEVIAQRRSLITFHGEGPGVDRLRPELAGRPASRPPRRSARRCMSAGRTARRWRRRSRPTGASPSAGRETRPTLEDVFIQLMGQAEDNFR